MKAEWTETRPNGQPITPGTFCRRIDLEDGTHPIYVYGATQAEVMEKIEQMNANAQLALQAARARTAPARQPAPAPQRAPISADQVMQATVDLGNPAKAGEAIETLIEARTGLSVSELAVQQFAERGQEWEREHPEFFRHPGNRELVGRHARALAGGSPAATTKEHFTQAFEELSARGMLFEGSNSTPLVENEPTPTPNNTVQFPSESQVQRERPRGTRFATGANGLRLGTVSRVQTGRTPKYTKEQIETMPFEKQRELNLRNDPDYIFACEYWYNGQGQATA